MQRIIVLVCLILASFAAPILMKRFTFGFKVAKMQLRFPNKQEWECPLNPEIHAMIAQPFHFIGKGAQCYVFASQDEQYVIKLFRYDQKRDLENKVTLLFNACKMAYDYLKEETGLIYVHLNTTSANLPVIHCTDAIYRSYEFALDDYRFALQKKGVGIREVLTSLQKDPQQMQKRLDQFIDLIESRAAREILNADSNLSRNFGFLEDRAIEFDFGNYRKSPGLNKKEEVQRYALKLRSWLSVNAPEWVNYLDKKVDAL